MEAKELINHFEEFLKTIEMNEYKKNDWVKASFEDEDFSNKLCNTLTLTTILKDKKIYEIKWSDEKAGKLNFIKHKILYGKEGEIGTTPFLILDVTQKGMYFNLNVTEVTPTHLNENIFIFEKVKFDKLLEIIELL